MITSLINICLLKGFLLPPLLLLEVDSNNFSLNFSYSFLLLMSSLVLIKVVIGAIRFARFIGIYLRLIDSES
jgi:hypothetical protein